MLFNFNFMFIFYFNLFIIKHQNAGRMKRRTSGNSQKSLSTENGCSSKYEDSEPTQQKQGLNKFDWRRIE